MLPDNKFLKVFRCSCFPLLRPYNSHKMDYRSTECIFLGYSPSHQGYKCLTLNGKLYISKDVLFNESQFPFKSMFKSISNFVTIVSDHCMSTASPPILHPKSQSIDSIPIPNLVCTNFTGTNTNSSQSKEICTQLQVLHSPLIQHHTLLLQQIQYSSLYILILLIQCQYQISVTQYQTLLIP